MRTVHQLAIALLALGFSGKDAFAMSMSIRYGKDRRFLKLPALP
jgi:hypothetical protein